MGLHPPSKEENKESSESDTITGTLVKEREFQHTHATFVRGIINTSALGLRMDDGLNFPATFLTNYPQTSFDFTSIGTYHYDPVTKESLYKIFSKEALTDVTLGRLFTQRSKVTLSQYTMMKTFMIKNLGNNPTTRLHFITQQTFYQGSIHRLACVSQVRFIRSLQFI